MRVLFIPWGLTAHYFQMVPLAWAFRAAGHEVRVAGQPSVFDAVTGSGLTINRVGSAYDFSPDTQRLDNQARQYMPILARRLAQDPVDSRPGHAAAAPATATRPMTEQQRQFVASQAARSPQEIKDDLRNKLAPFIKAAEDMAGDLVALARSWQPDLVVADPFVIAAPLAAQAADAPLIHHLWGPALHRRTGFYPGSGMSVDLWPDELSRLFGRYRTPLREEYAVATVDPCPASMQFPGIPERLPFRYVPYNGPGEAPAWLLNPPTRRRICVTWGTLATPTAGGKGFLVPQIMTALAALDVEVIVTLTAAERALIEHVPPNARLCDQLPLHLLLPTCDAVVHQGGGGTMLTAASLGLPQVMITGLIGHTGSAARICAIGAGVALDWADATPQAIVGSVSAALADGPREAARLLRQEILDQPTPAATVAVLEPLARSARQPTEQGSLS